MRLILPAAAFAALLGASPALAAPQLVQAEPAEGAVAAHPAKIQLTFDTPLNAAASGLVLVMTAMPGMADHQPMTMNGVRATVSGDGKALVAPLPRSLPEGRYELRWHGADAQGGKAQGVVHFEVK